MHHHIL